MEFDRFLEMWRGLEEMPRECIEAIDVDGMKRFTLVGNQIHRVDCERNKHGAHASWRWPAEETDLEWLRTGLECETVVLVSRRIFGALGVRPMGDAGKITRVHYGRLPASLSPAGSGLS